MTFMDGVQILILVILLLLLLKPFYAGWLPNQWRQFSLRIMPPRALKQEGIWRRNSSKSDKT